jgi:hypothetical protein
VRVWSLYRFRRNRSCHRMSPGPTSHRAPLRRADVMGNEIKGVTQEWKEAFSTRTQQVDAKERRLALDWDGFQDRW